MPSGTSPCRREADNGPKTARPPTRPPPSAGRVSRGDSYRGGIGTAPQATPRAQGHRVSTRREGQAGGSEVLSTGLDPVAGFGAGGRGPAPRKWGAAWVGTRVPPGPVRMGFC